MSTPAEVHVYALYGPGQPLNLTLRPGGRFRFTLSGNVVPLLPLPEFGLWESAGAADADALAAAVNAAALAAPSNALSAPDSAFVHVTIAPGGGPRQYALYDPPGPWAPVQGRLFALVNGPWRAERVRTAAGAAAWELATIETGAGAPAVRVTLTSTGAQPALLSEPGSGEQWMVGLFPQGLPDDEAEDYPWDLTPDEFRVEGRPVTGATVRLDRGAAATVRVVILRVLRPGIYRAELRYRSHDDGDRRPPPALITGLLTLDAGLLTVTAPPGREW